MADFSVNIPLTSKSAHYARIIDNPLITPSGFQISKIRETGQIL